MSGGIQSACHGERPAVHACALKAPQSLGEQTARNVRKAAFEFVEVDHVGEKLANEGCALKDQCTTGKERRISR